MKLSNNNSKDFSFKNLEALQLVQMHNNGLIKFVMLSFENLTIFQKLLEQAEEKGYNKTDRNEMKQKLILINCQIHQRNRKCGPIEVKQSRQAYEKNIQENICSLKLANWLLLCKILLATLLLVIGLISTLQVLNLWDSFEFSYEVVTLMTLIGGAMYPTLRNSQQLTYLLISKRKSRYL